MAEKGNTEYFNPKARLLTLLGEQLITSEIIAVVELAKNSYDADATEVNVILNNITDPQSGEIIIEDNGTGINVDNIKVWFEPATDFRSRQRDKGERTPKFGRLLLGEKGIGRFAAHKLGSQIELITRAEGGKDEIVVKVNWEDFRKDKYLSEIPVTWIKREPELFRDEKYGTKLIIKGLRKVWNEKMVSRLAVKLQALSSPFTDTKDFRIKLDVPEFREKLEEVPEMPEILEKAVYMLEGNTDENGVLHFDYRFFNPVFEHLKHEMKERVEDVRVPPQEFEGSRKPYCGPFKVRFYAWDLDPATLGETIQSTFYKRIVKPHTGIRIYRDGFRVWPYGEEDDDSFSLDSRRVNNPRKCISRNQIIGMIEISSSGNPELRDKTDREGLILNKEYEDFCHLVIGALSVLEIERRKDKDKVDALREKTKPEDEVQRSIDSIKDKMQRKGHIEIYEDDVKRIESTYRQRIKEILEPMLVSAGLGIAYVLPVHEIIRNVEDVEKLLGRVIEDVKKAGEAERIIERIKDILNVTEIVEDMVKGVGKLTRKGRRETVSVDSIINDAMDIIQLRLKKDNIDIEYIGEKSIKISCLKNMIVTAILNILDNSTYWLLHRVSGRKIVIKTDRDSLGRPRILISDNGPGIKDDPSLIVQPFFTRKPDGSGLGLYIVDRIMKVHKGELKFLRSTEEKNLLEGANVALIFPEESREDAK